MCVFVCLCVMLLHSYYIVIFGVAMGGEKVVNFCLVLDNNIFAPALLEVDLGAYDIVTPALNGAVGAAPRHARHDCRSSDW